MELAHLLEDLRRDAGFMANVSAWQILSPQPARTEPLPSRLHPHLIQSLGQRGIDSLYSHQSRAVNRALDGKNVAVVTPTASGKTLCYGLPTLHELLIDPDATALYLFPTKALAHDQLDEIESWLEAMEALTGTGADAQPIRASTYDGDTPSGQRARIRRECRLIVTNPDMLHTGILPYHANWSAFFSGLRTVVLDEMHVYRGIFGSHVGNVIRRLRRIAAFYGSRPRFLLSSATIANPGELAKRLVEEPVELIDENGAPQGEKHLVLYNPPLYDPARGLRRSSVLECQELGTRLIEGGLQTILFARSRLTVEILLTYLRQRLLRNPAPDSFAGGSPMSVADGIRGYRGGYLAEERRSIEAGLRNGDVRGVVTTNALELGIDIGRLQAAILCGYPGTIASTWQQMGRAGRSSESSIAILVATGGALDQYVVQHPDFLLGRSPEQALADPDNLMLLVDQMRCAAFELPFEAGEQFGNSAFSDDVLSLLVEEGAVQTHAARYLWSGSAYPSRQISLRSAGIEPVLIQAGDPARIVGEVDMASAPLLVHDGAVYIHEGQSYLVTTLDLEERIARVEPASVDFYTEAASETTIEVLDVHEQKLDEFALSAHGSVEVTWQVTGYRRVRHYTHENMGLFPLEFPPQTLETNGFWLEVSEGAQQALALADRWYDAPNDYGPNWQSQRRKVRERDGYCCRECGAAEPSAGQHDVHHLRPFRTFGYVRGVNERYREANRLANLIYLCRRCHRRIEAGSRTRGGLDGLGYVLGNLAPLHLMCDRSDIGVSVLRSGEERSGENGPRVYIFERIPDGLGFSARLFALRGTLLSAGAELVRHCPCRAGCPACVGPVPLDSASGRPLLDTKELTLALLTVLQGQRVEPRQSETEFEEVLFQKPVGDGE